MGNNFYGISYKNNPPVVNDAEHNQEIITKSAEIEDSLPVISDNENVQEINVYGGQVIPELPKLLDNEQINVYVPIAGKTFPGISFFNPEHFHIAVNGFVSLLKGGIDKIEKISSENGIDTWGIFLTDGRVEYFTIENGKPGTPGVTPLLKCSEDDELYVSYDNGENWSFIGKLPPGPPGPKGDSFEVKKVYTSIEAMNQGFSTDDVPVGGLVLINTDDVENDDNAKLFVKHEDAYHYLTDMSGAQGIQGPPGYTPVKGKDYFTPKDKQTLIDDILELIPFAEGVSV